ncbi:acriflavine resistance protein B [Moorena producens PAL-8-15-08-1]|uniref:Acriflavine resistance protein B n=1 Tax=Moorena producens PAL-8-15-08-1 TaxID=1458985 RepID=A0A1D8TVV5_9CYAN|nr:efflux RND transporter permease subunit [Moorena producens]AOX01779.1 acriflavine resistance protein B [Moorena producens PAL-8-15-08-1]
MWNLFYRNSRLLILTICLILVWGLSSFGILPRMEDPTQSQWFGLVNTEFPGASAERVESLVTDQVEQELLEIEEIKYLESTSRLGSSTVVIALEDSVQNHDQVWSRVRDRLADVTPKLPQEVLEPEYKELRTANTLIVALTWDLETPANYAILRRQGKNLESELRTLPGTEKVELFGAPTEEIVVEINPTDLATLGLTPQELSQQIRLSDAKVAAGQIRNSTNNLLLEVETELDSLDRIRQIPIRVANKSGQFARLGDIANVKKSILEPPSELAIINRKPAIALAVLMDSKKRIDQWTKAAHQNLEKFQSSLPPGIELELIFDQSHYVNNRLNNLFKNLILGTLCVVGSTVLMMGWKSALIVGSSLPLSVLMVFGAMRLLEIPLHQISVTGLVIALGMLIDNAIVVVDEMQTLLKSGIKPFEAISKTVSYLAVPLLASTLTTALTFMPIALLPGSAGEFVKTLALCVILALFSSLLISLTIIPALIGRIHNLNYEQRIINDELREVHSSLIIHNSHSGGWWNTGLSQPALTRLYRRCLDAMLARPVLGLLLALILPITGFVMASSLSEQFFPPAERDQFNIELELPSSASLSETQSVALQARDILRRHRSVVNVHWFFGKSAPSFYYNLAQNRQNSPNYAQGLVQLASATETRQQIKALQEELDQAFPKVRVLVRQLEQGPPILAPIELRIYGPNLDTLQKLGNQVREELAGVANVTHTRSSLGEALPKLGLRLDEEQARLTGLNNTQIAQQLNGNLEGTLGGSILEGTEELPVRVRLGKRDRGNLDQIATLDLLPTTIPSNQNPPTVPLSALGEIELVPELATITRRHGQRVNTVQGFITAGVLPSTVLADFRERLETSDFQLPPGYSLEWGGESAERNEAVGNLLSTVGVLVVLMVATLVLSFGSFRSAGIIALVGIGSIGLALASLWMFDYPLGFMAILGTVGLVGVAINDSIVVLAALRSDSMARQGNRKAMVEVIVLSTRHVLTTTITTVAGFVPLLLDGGQFWPPLAICIAGGVGGATLLALLFVPCAYLLLFGRSPRVRDRQYRTLTIEHFNANSTPTVGGHHYE